jgi:long-chain acyl-CoA synthetase
MEYPPLTKSFLEAVDRFASPRAQMYRTAEGWQTIAAQEMLRRVAGLSKALGELGIKSGDRVAILAPNCPEWHIADFAIQGVGAASVPIYFNESPERLTYIMNDSGARIIFTSGEAQARKIAECRDKINALEHVIAVTPLSDLHGDVLRYETLIATAGQPDVAEYRKRAAEVSASQLLTIIYTSGTTGEPKGVMLTHSNVSSNVIDSLAAYDFSPEDLALSFLPLAHVYERTVDYGYLFRGVPIAYVEQMEAVPHAFLELKPTYAAAVPRFFEKIYANIVDKGRSETGLKRKIFDWSLRVAQESIPWRAYGKAPSVWTKQRWQIADRIVYSKIRAGLGGRIRYFFSGGAPLAPDLSEFFWSVNLPVLEGYGLTETAPVIASNVPKKNRVGTVGMPISHVEVRIADDGEILVKGPCVMQGYFHKPEQSREVLSSDGWFSTGDIGRLDQDGYLIITDRKKELLKTAAGKFVAPAPIENLLKQSPFITNAIVVGDKRKFVSVLVVPNFAAVEREARGQNKDSPSPSQALSNPWVRDLLSREIERLTASLAQYEKPKRFALIEKDFTFASGELTYTLKIKRRVIEDHYRDLIDRLYADLEEPRPQHST